MKQKKKRKIETTYRTIANKTTSEWHGILKTIYMWCAADGHEFTKGLNHLGIYVEKFRSFKRQTMRKW